MKIVFCIINQDSKILLANLPHMEEANTERWHGRNYNLDHDKFGFPGPQMLKHHSCIYINEIKTMTRIRPFLTYKCTLVMGFYLIVIIKVAHISELQFKPLWLTCVSVHTCVSVTSKTFKRKVRFNDIWRTCAE